MLFFSYYNVFYKRVSYKHKKSQKSPKCLKDYSLSRVNRGNFSHWKQGERMGHSFSRFYRGVSGGGPTPNLSAWLERIQSIRISIVEDHCIPRICLLDLQPIFEDHHRSPSPSVLILIHAKNRRQWYNRETTFIAEQPSLSAILGMFFFLRKGCVHHPLRIFCRTTRKTQISNLIALTAHPLHTHTAIISALLKAFRSLIYFFIQTRCVDYNWFGWLCKPQLFRIANQL